MKKILYTLIAVFLTAASCSRSEFQPMQEEQDGKVTFVMKATFPEPLIATKARDFADKPMIESIRVAVFGGEGYLNDYTLAIPVTASNVILPNGYADLENGQEFYFRVTLNATTSKCSVHIIANGPEQLDYQTKVGDIMLHQTTSLTTAENGIGGYWAFFDLPNGNAAFDASGKYVPNNDATTKFNSIKLIRNFARIEVTESLDNFTLEGFNIYNYPNKGFFSIWDGVTYAVDDKGRMTDNPQFISDYHTYQIYKSTVVEGYDANKDITLRYPTPFVNDDITFNTTAPSASQTFNTNTKYVFERSASTGTKPFIIIKGKYKDGETEYASSYYRIELVNEDGVYLPIYRNFDYTINLTSVSKNGIADPSKAVASNGNITANISSSLSEVSNGAGRMLVFYTERTFVKGENDTDPREFQYAFIPDVIGAPGTYGNVTLSTPTPQTGGAIASVADDWDDNASTTEWTKVHFYLADPAEDGSVKTSTFQVTGVDKNGKKLYRTITVKLLPIQKFDDATFSPNGTAAGSEVCLNLQLPVGLPESMFPIRFIFEDSARLLSPKGQDMPVETDVPSIIPGKTGSNYYHFVKEVSAAEYQAATNRIIACRFKRIATGTTTLYISDKAGYFEPKNVSTSGN